MDNFVKLPSEEKARYFDEASKQIGLSPQMIEKDFWVCWMLRLLFGLEEVCDHLTFKGGTSLSKAYNIIKRFSEDIDVSIARSDHWPVEVKDISSYVSQAFSEAFSSSQVTFKVLKAERTFWEKATILYMLHYYPEEKKLPTRMSRHYYDLYQLYQSPIHESAVKNFELLKRVAEHKSLYFRAAWAKYDEAYPGSLKLLPKPERRVELKGDYERMQPMFFDTPASFDKIFEGIERLEKEINEEK